MPRIGLVEVLERQQVVARRRWLHNVGAMWRVHAASLPRPVLVGVEAAPNSRKPQELAIPGASTNPSTRCNGSRDGRSDQCA